MLGLAPVTREEDDRIESKDDDCVESEGDDCVESEEDDCDRSREDDCMIRGGCIEGYLCACGEWNDTPVPLAEDLFRLRRMIVWLRHDSQKVLMTLAEMR